jgi:hypothetical protein
MNAMGTARTDSTRSVPLLSAVPLFILLLLAACGGDDLLLPRDGEPAKIAAVNPENLTATVGQPLADSLVAEVTDPAGRPVQGVEVTFVPPDGASIQPTEPVTTNASGQAAVHYVLSTTAGEQVVEARASAIVPDSNGLTSFHVAAQPESPESLAMAGGNGQTAQVSTMLPESLAVRAVDRFGNGVPGVEVIWQSTGGGEVSPQTDTTGADGRAAVAHILGNSPGSYGAVAKAQALEGPPVAFIATAVPAPKPVLALVTPPSQIAVAGVTLEQQPEIQLQDPTGAPLPRKDVKVTVDVGVGGSLGGNTSRTSDENGRVTFTDLEFRAGTGTRTLIFSAAGFTPVTSPEIAVRPGKPSGKRSSLSVSGGEAGQKTTMSLRLKDDFNNDIPGASADLSIRISGANPSEDIPVTEISGGSYTASYVPVHTGKDDITVEFRGEPLPDVRAATTVAPGPADPSTSTAEVKRRQIGVFAAIDVAVTVRDGQGNLVGRGGDQVQISVNGSQPRTCVVNGRGQNPPRCNDNQDGTYTDAFVLVTTKGVRLDIQLNGTPLAGSPYDR